MVNCGPAKLESRRSCPHWLEPMGGLGPRAPASRAAVFRLPCYTRRLGRLCLLKPARFPLCPQGNCHSRCSFGPTLERALSGFAYAACQIPGRVRLGRDDRNSELIPAVAKSGSTDHGRRFVGFRRSRHGLVALYVPRSRPPPARPRRATQAAGRAGSFNSGN